MTHSEMLRHYAGLLGKRKGKDFADEADRLDRRKAKQQARKPKQEKTPETDWRKLMKAEKT